MLFPSALFACASPEQIRGEAVTTASDVYSLGVFLYTLLTGGSPYRTAIASGMDLETAVCDAVPERPSLTVTRVDSIAADESKPASSEALSAMREGSPEKLRRRLEGDLDNIILMAMRKEPQRRYASADQLSEDISRHLTNLPVIARPDTRRYRMSKFVPRHTAGVVTASLLFVSLTGGIATTLWQAHVARQLMRCRSNVQESVAHTRLLINTRAGLLSYRLRSLGLERHMVFAENYAPRVTSSTRL